MSHSELIMDYFRNPINNFEPDNYTLTHHEGNSVCGDDITIFLTLQDQNNTILSQTAIDNTKDTTIASLHFTGNPSIVTAAAASFTADLIPGTPTQELLTRNYQTLQEQGFEVSPRRKRAAVITIMAIQNALYIHQGVKQKTTFDDLLDDY